MSPQIVCLFAEAKIRVGPYKWSAEWQGPLPAREAAGGPTRSKPAVWWGVAWATSEGSGASGRWRAPAPPGPLSSLNGPCQMSFVSVTSACVCVHAHTHTTTHTHTHTHAMNRLTFTGVFRTRLRIARVQQNHPRAPGATFPASALP